MSHDCDDLRMMSDLPAVVIITGSVRSTLCDVVWPEGVLSCVTCQACPVSRNSPN